MPTFQSGWKCRCARRAIRLDRADGVPAYHGRGCGLRGRTAHKRRGNPFGSPSSCESPSPLSGRAARVKLGDAFHLPPNRCCDRQGIGCYPRGVRGRIVRPHGTRPERRLHGNNRLKPYIVSTPASRVRRKTKLPRRNRKSNFSTECGQICLRSRAPASLPRRG